MNIAFCLYKYFPYGGLQRDFLRIARACHRRGHSIRVYVLSWQGEVPDWLTLTIAPKRGLSNTGRYRHFTAWLQQHLAAEPADLLVGFNKMPHLDVYYAADPCFARKARHLRPWYYRLSPRYRHFSRYERAVFDPAGNTRIMLISSIQKAQFQHYYGTPETRLHLLPPGIDPGRRAPPDADARRRALRQAFAIGDDESLLLLVGSNFALKGLGRALRALAALPAERRHQTRLFVVGQDDPEPFLALARRLDVADRVRFLGGRDDVLDFMLAADLLVHPAESESAGLVLLEAVVAGLPVLVTEVCGYAHHVVDAGAGDVVPEPFRQDDLNRRLEAMVAADKSRWRDNALRYADSADLYSLPERAADIIEDVGGGRA